MMNPKNSVLSKLLWLIGFAVVCTCQDFDFWPGSYCDSKQSCCYPKTGKPASDFSIHGLWPNYNDGSYPSNCDPENQFDPSKISDLSRRMQTDWPSLACPSSDSLSFWAHEWDKHGTCSQSVLGQHDYFATALNLKQQLNLLQILGDAGIEPNGGVYSLSSIKDAIKGGSGYEAWIECNMDIQSGNRQLYQVYMCLDASASNIIDCPVLPHGKCSSTIEFPPF
ncbi:ribonuclease 1-like [Sesamum indicum]|uniref:Ribonuclease 1-like n=1 Tax=Sesamum indicum TaxID=4182 RepID=A0A6I9SNT5_SESIN|nr:ribonuclease 1-like [Sesamum indicum]